MWAVLGGVVYYGSVIYYAVWAVSGGVVYYCPMWAIAGSIFCGTVNWQCNLLLGSMCSFWR